MLTRTLSVVVLIGLIAPLLAACGGQTTTPAPSAPAPTAVPTTAAGQPAATSASGEDTGTPAAAAGDKLLVASAAAHGSTLRNFNPFSQAALFGTNNCAFEPLMIINTITGEIVPWLATDYTFSDDAMTLTVTIREGVLWSDGQPFTANDVAFTFNLLRDKPGLQGPALGAMSALGGYVDTVTAPDAKTVVFTLKQPFSPAIYDIFPQNIVPEHVWKSIDDPSKFTNENPVGTGPFTEVANFSPEQYEVRSNPHYWQAEKITFGGLKVRQGIPAGAGELAIVDGTYDWTGGNIPNIDQTYVAKDPEHRGYWSPAIAATIALVMPTTKEPFNDVDVRKAISMAINRQQIAAVGMANSTHPADVTGLHDGYPQWKVADPSTLASWADYNVDEANRLLDAAGLTKGADGIRVNADGTPMKYEIHVVQGFNDWTRAGDIVVQNFKAVGISASLKPMDFGAFFDVLMKGEFDMSLGFVGGATPYQVYRAAMSASTTAPIGQPAYLGNYARFVSAKADELLDQWAATTDPARQKDIAAQLQQEFADGAPVLPLWPQPSWMIFKTNNFTGFPTRDDPYALGTPDGNNTNMLLVILNLRPQ